MPADSSHSAQADLPPTHHIELLYDASMPEELPDAELTELSRWFLDKQGVTRPWTVNIVLTDSVRLSSLHGAFLGDSSPTDIMTFPFTDRESGIDEPAQHGGEIVISVEDARIQAADAGWSLADELRFLVLHGLLHLSGWNDDSPQARSAMLQEQHRLLAEWKGQLAAGTP